MFHHEIRVTSSINSTESAHIDFVLSPKVVIEVFQVFLCASVLTNLDELDAELTTVDMALI